MASKMEVEGDAIATKQPTLSNKDYAALIKRLSDNLIRKDVRKVAFLCYEFIKDKAFLAKKDLTAFQLFTEMTRNGSLSRENVTVLSQIMYLIGKKKLQKEELTSKGIPAWNPEMKSIISDFRYLLYKLYQDIRSQDLKSMKEQCLLSGRLTNAEEREIEDALDLFTALVDNQHISEENIKVLCSLVKVLDNAKMNNIIETYKETFMKPSEKGKLLDAKGLPCLAWHSSPQNTDSYMDERSAGPLLKGPGHFSVEPQAKYNNLDNPKSDLTSHLLVSGTTYHGQDSESSMYLQLSGKGDESLSTELPSAMDACSTLSSNSSEQARIDKKTEEIEDELKKVGAAGDAGMDEVCHPSESPNLEDMDVSESFSQLGIPGGPIDTQDYNLTIRTESQQDQMEQIKRDYVAAAECEPGGQSELQRQELQKLKRAKEKEKQLESVEPGGQSELQRQELQKLKRAKEKEKQLESVDSGGRSELQQQEEPKLKKTKDLEKVPMQETSRANGDTDYTHPSMPIPSIHRPPPSKVYPMESVPRGKCLLLMYDKYDVVNEIKHAPRKGNAVDIAMLTELFGNILQFEVILQHNKTLDETNAIIKEMRKSQEHGDCFVCFVCSHGNGKAFLTKDGKWLDFQKLYENFTADNCKALIEKPKVFFINACLKEEEGVRYQETVKIGHSICSDGPESAGIGAKDPSLAPRFGHFCISYSTVAGYSSARHTVDGTFFVQNIYKVFTENYKRDHLLDLLTEVRKSMNEQLLALENHDLSQESPDYSTLHKRLYFTNSL